MPFKLIIDPIAFDPSNIDRVFSEDFDLRPTTPAAPPMITEEEHFGAMRQIVSRISFDNEEVANPATDRQYVAIWNMVMDSPLQTLAELPAETPLSPLLVAAQPAANNIAAPPPPVNTFLSANPFATWAPLLNTEQVPNTVALAVQLGWINDAADPNAQQFAEVPFEGLVSILNCIVAEQSSTASSESVPSLASTLPAPATVHAPVAQAIPPINAPDPDARVLPRTLGPKGPGLARFLALDVDMGDIRCTWGNCQGSFAHDLKSFLAHFSANHPLPTDRTDGTCLWNRGRCGMQSKYIRTHVQMCSDAAASRCAKCGQVMSKQRELVKHMEKCGVRLDRQEDRGAGPSRTQKFRVKMEPY